MQPILITINQQHHPSVSTNPKIFPRGSHVTGLSSCQNIACEKPNQPKRLEFAQRYLHNKDNFDDVIFTYESSIQMEWRLQNTRPRPNFASIHVYALPQRPSLSTRRRSEAFTVCLALNTNKYSITLFVTQ